MHDRENIRSLAWGVVYLAIAVALIGVLFFSSQWSLWVRVASFAGILFIIYSVLEAKALHAKPIEELKDPVVGKEVEVIEAFVFVGGGYEGRVLLNGAPWSARSETRQLGVGDTAKIHSITGQTLHLL